MRVLHLIDSVGVYGAEVMLLHLVAEQIKKGLEPIIASIGAKGIREKPLETEARKRGLRVEKFRMIPGPNYLGAFEILRFAWREGVNILHSHGYKGNILFGLIPKRIRRIPIITTVHGYTSTGNGYSRMRLYEWLDSRALRFMDAVVFVSNAMKSDARFKHLDPSKVRVIHNGIPLEHDSTQQTQSTTQQFNQSPNQLLDQSLIAFCRQGLTLGSIGRLSPEKGYIYLIDALKIIRDKGHDVRLVIIGEGVERDALERKIQDLGLEAYVMLPGYKENASSYLGYFNIFLLPSLTEGLPMTILEAMRAKVPIVATKVGGITEILEDHRSGLFAESVKPKSIVSAILRIINERQLSRTMVDNGYRVLGKKFSALAMSSLYTITYQVLD